MSVDLWVDSFLCVECGNEYCETNQTRHTLTPVQQTPKLIHDFPDWPETPISQDEN